MGRISRTTLGLVMAAACASRCTGRRVHAQEITFPDFDLRVECMPRAMGNAGDFIRFPAAAVLRTSPAGTDGRVGARAWSLSLATGPGARIVDAGTEDTPAQPSPAGLRDDGYEVTELTQGEGNGGVVSAVILSFSKDIYLPGSGEETLLRLVVETMVPTGCADVGVGFLDGLVGSGQPVKNIITYGEDFGFTRRDDGGDLDNDTDGYEPCTLVVCDGPSFLRGDADGDLRLSLSDAILILEHLFLETGQLDCPDAGDVLGEGDLNLSDGIYLLNHLFLGGPPPAAPYPACGLAPLPEDGTLGCDPATRCE